MDRFKGKLRHQHLSQLHALELIHDVWQSKARNDAESVRVSKKRLVSVYILLASLSVLTSQSMYPNISFRTSSLCI